MESIRINALILCPRCGGKDFRIGYEAGHRNFYVFCEPCSLLIGPCEPLPQNRHS